MRSATCSALNRSCVAISTPMPARLASSRLCANSWAAAGSSPEVGSSSSMALAWRAWAIARPTFWRMPLE
ncbi:hypothetical protein D3C85_1450630 [compost metagenome]